MKTQKTSKSKTTPTKTTEIKTVMAETDDPAYQTIVRWLKSRNLNEKMTAVLMSILLAAESRLPGKNIGNKFLCQWTNEVFTNKIFTKPQGGDFGFMAGFCYAIDLIGE